MKPCNHDVVFSDFSHYDNHVTFTTPSGQVIRGHYNNGTPERLLLDAHKRLKQLERQKLTRGTTIPPQISI